MKQRYFKKTIIHLTVVTVCIGFLAGCGKKEEEHGEEQKAHEENVVTLSKESLEHIDLKVEQVVLGNLGMTLKVPGRVALNLNKTAQIASTLEGRITKLNVDLGDAVKKGGVLAVIESPELLGKQLEIKSPIDGVITNRTATTGELVDKSKEFLTVSDPLELWVIAEVKERDIAAIKVGQQVSFQVLSYPEKKFHGAVILVGNQVEEDSRTLEVRVTAENRDGLLKPGMFADVSVVTTMLENVLSIPDESLQTDGENQVVFVALDENRFEKRVVHLGLEQEGRVQILDGIAAGDKIVTLGSFVLKSEMLKGELGEE